MTDIVITRGDTETLDVTVRGADGEPANITGFGVAFTAKRLASDPDTDAVLAYSIGDGIEFVDPLVGTLTVTIDPADSAALRPGTYDYDVQTDDAGRISTVARGVMRVEADVTRAT